MNNIDLKIAFRTFLKGKWYSLLNITGLALGLAAFIFVALYVDNEKSYDRWNKNVDRIFLVGRELSNGPSPYTPGGLAEAIKSQCPEVEEVGRTNTALFQLPFFTGNGKFLIRNWVGADYSIAKILGIKPKGATLDPKAAQPTVLLSKATAQALFPGKSEIHNQTVSMSSKTSGMLLPVAGVAADAPGNTNFQFDCIGFSPDLTLGKDQSYANQIYRTYLLVKPNADIAQLFKKIDKIYKEAVLADSSMAAKQVLNRSDAPAIYLDRLDDLHLRPHDGSHVANQIVQGLTALAIIILVVTAVNFTILYIAQANKRAKEVGIKKVNGIGKRQIATQFLLEIFIQCVIALLIAFVVVLIGLPYFNQLLRVNLLISGINLSIVAQLLASLVILTLLAGIYPAMVMAGFKPALVLRGDQFTNAGKFAWVKGSATMLQFTFAVIFIIMVVVINQQVTYMKTEDPGFSAKQVIYVDNQMIFNDAQKFDALRNRIKAIDGVKHVSVASNVPGGIMPATHEFTVRDKAFAMHTIGVDREYFATLNIAVKEGRLFATNPVVDTAGAVINEAAARAMGIKQVIGASINGAGGNYKVIGVVKDVRSEGFERATQPTLYLTYDKRGINRTQIIISAEQKAIPGMLKTLDKQWRDINKLDGDNFNYHFLDELYGQHFIKQEQLQAVLIWFSGLAVFIASLGFFASAAHAIRVRMKEIAIRKVFGAGADQLLVTLSKPFFYTVLLANLVAWPVAYLIAQKWLETFAYRVSLSAMPFVVAFVVSVSIVVLTVCLQIVRAVRFNPAMKLKV
ncbi:ABC transporter permease [Mucilaginibacter myungsuensis]|uniref:ABC transporter permease n=1 Tax=Mucilaginibacter myungsuensis TaxID=649104 RepID=A0A929L1A3_9SPHI|nr:ABC transporter permease [Mucilaginibacter myungsuensis]MBE9661426.1 ABC transporter permease [Mucilaginibacter myungsuensis]MDN3597569.1 ABC transporter permease [Mucilaginibacter myungsuensis]